MPATNTDIRDRVEEVERHQIRFDERLESVDNNVKGLVNDIRVLIERDRTRPDPVSWRAVVGSIAAMFGLIAMVGTFAYWFVDRAPSVIELSDQVRTLTQRQAAMVRAIEVRTGSRHSQQDELIACLRSEIANKRIGFICAHPARLPHSADFKSTITIPPSVVSPSATSPLTSSRQPAIASR